MNYNRIRHPYAYAANEKELITRLYHRGSDWDKTQFKSLKQNLRLFLRYQQGNFCCYCKKELGYDIGETHIEHIVSRNEYADYGFEPYNLAISCPGCNEKKGDKPVCINVPSNIYSHKSKDYMIVHPYFDDYNQHIQVDGPLRIALSTKGQKTIEYCELSRLRRVEQEKIALDALMGNDTQKRMCAILNSHNNEEVNTCLNEISNFIKEVKLRRN